MEILLGVKFEAFQGLLQHLYADLSFVASVAFVVPQLPPDQLLTEFYLAFSLYLFAERKKIKIKTETIKDYCTLVKKVLKCYPHFLVSTLSQFSLHLVTFNKQHKIMIEEEIF